jgi:Protein of unknown function with PCYCGC motif
MLSERWFLEEDMKKSKKQTWILGAALLCGFAMILGSETRSAAHYPVSSPQTSNSIQHHYHDSPPAQPVARVLEASQFLADRPTFVAYSLAARIPSVLYQEPCYCGCDRSQLHESLLDCFTGRHGVSCPACKREAIFCFEETRNGRTPPQIRDDLHKGNWSRMDLDRYVKGFDESRRGSQFAAGKDDQ